MVSLESSIVGRNESEKYRQLEVVVAVRKQSLDNLNPGRVRPTDYTDMSSARHSKVVHLESFHRYRHLRQMPVPVLFFGVD